MSNVVHTVTIKSPTLPIDNTTANAQILQSPGQVLYDHTQSASLSDGNGSFRPASFDFQNTASLTLSIYFSVGIGASGSLVGRHPMWKNGNVFTSSNVTTQQGTNDVPVHIDQGDGALVTVLNSSFPRRIAGDIQWVWVSSGTEQSLGSTRLELYSLPIILPKLYGGRVPVKLLRAFIPNFFASIQTNWVAFVANTVFSDMGLRYNSWNSGQNRYVGQSGGGLDIARWLADYEKCKKDSSQFTLINCYDQAAMVQVALGLGLIPEDAQTIKWKFLEPYGFIQTTNLVGRGRCNSPYVSNQQSSFLVDNNADIRQAFRNHAFIEVKQCVVDACAGPHTGTESPAAYLARAIEPPSPPNDDEHTTLYPTAPQLGPRSKASLGINDPAKQHRPGNITDYNVSTPSFGITTLRDFTPREALEAAATNATDLVSGAGTSNSPILQPLVFSQLALTNKLTVVIGGRDVGTPDVDVNPEIVNASWSFKDNNNANVEIEIDLLPDYITAQRYFALELDSYDDYAYNFPQPLPASGTQYGEFCVASPSTLIFAKSNVMAIVNVVDGHVPDISGQYGNAIDGVLTNFTKPPNLLEISCDPPLNVSTMVGSTFTITVTFTNAADWDVWIDPLHNDAIVLLNETVLNDVSNSGSVEFTFLAAAIGEPTVKITFAHPDTLQTLTASGKFHVN
ncbi:uncharacterized protein KY384_008736 [Bacidia gigantensis]|uniref:uncharacterized protein n=1 Tax=Bacidia gigantensis TaxID=2732470 RepID=UPI001D042318|nr:uncharacterized protein KY384_008736 [Bacidia gigantensis]KAG8526536.1 hypothetical protein KY384_008736 [Bacidia gigantensis]